MSGVFGPIIWQGSVEAAVTQLLKDWMDTYLREMERVTGRSSQLPSIRAWGLGDLEDRLEEQQPPALMVECAKARMQASSDAYRAAWETTVALVTKSDKGLKQSRELAAIYTTAASLILIQQSDQIGDFLWEEQEYGVLAAGSRRYLARGECKGVLTISQVAEIEGGPTEPAPDPANPPGGYPLVETIDVTVNE